MIATADTAAITTASASASALQLPRNLLGQRLEERWSMTARRDECLAHIRHRR